MPPRLLDPHSRAFTLLLGFGAGLLVLFIVLYPEQAFHSSLSGLTLWWKLVFPALMPFLMLSELLTGFGVVHAVGVLLNPLLRPLFRIPGVAGWAIASGLLGGYPAGADAAARLHEHGLIGNRDAERLVALAHVCNPVTMITVVGAGLLRSPQAGLLIALIHYISAFVACIPLAFARSDNSASGKQTRLHFEPSRSIFREAVAAMADARTRDGRTFGKLLGDAVFSSIQTLLQLGGFIMLFSVFHQVLRGLIPFIARSRLGDSALSGLLEPHIAASGFAGLSTPLIWQAACIGAALGWSGLAQHAQVLSLTRSRHIRFAPFLLTRCLHAVFAFVITLVLWRPLGSWIQAIQPGAAVHVFAAHGEPDHFPLSGYAAAIEALLPFWLALLVCIVFAALFSRLVIRR